ncbi:MAG: transposase [Oceanospirillaceae bacterium]|nr:transposase [Oceanospirillaceae bacterium]
MSQLSAFLTKLTVEAALKVEINHYLCYDKNASEGHHSGNSRNGSSSKTLKGSHGEIELQTPRDRNGTFEPQIVKKGQSRITGMDDQILCLYAKGMSTRDIVASFQEMYSADISAGLVSQVTNSVIGNFQIADIKKPRYLARFCVDVLLQPMCFRLLCCAQTCKKI